jgi:hypothetical protein
LGAHSAGHDRQAAELAYSFPLCAKLRAGLDHLAGTGHHQRIRETAFVVMHWLSWFGEGAGMLFAKGLSAGATAALVLWSVGVAAQEHSPRLIQVAQSVNSYDVTDVPIYTRDWVSELQSRLVEIGYDVDTQSGAFTEQTRKAIVDFQSSHDLAVTGQPTPSLMRSLRSIEARPTSSE